MQLDLQGHGGIGQRKVGDDLWMQLAEVSQFLTLKDKRRTPAVDE